MLLSLKKEEDGIVRENISKYMKGVSHTRVNARAELPHARILGQLQNP